MIQLSCIRCTVLGSRVAEIDCEVTDIALSYSVTFCTASIVSVEDRVKSRLFKNWTNQRSSYTSALL